MHIHTHTDRYAHISVIIFRIKYFISSGVAVPSEMCMQFGFIHARFVVYRVAD